MPVLRQSCNNLEGSYFIIVPFISYATKRIKLGKGLWESGYGTPIQYATIKGQLNLVKFIFDAIKIEKPKYTDKDLNPQNFQCRGCTPFHIAVVKGHLNIVNYFCEELNRVNISAKFELATMTPLHLACWEGHIDIVKTMLKAIKLKNPNFRPDDINPANNYQRTPLQIAIQHGYADIVKYFSTELV